MARGRTVSASTAARLHLPGGGHTPHVPSDLYALAPEEFVAARDEQVRQARADGDRERAAALATLRRPTLPAHLVNLLTRAEPDLVSRLAGLGRQIDQAQRSGNAADLRGLAEQRRALVALVVDRAVDLGGRPVTAAVRQEVAGTLEACLADPAAAEAVLSGRLVRSLSFAGFGGADVEGAVADESGGPADGAAATTPAPGAAQGSRRTSAADRAAAREQVRAAEAAAQDAAGRLDDAVRAVDRARRAAERAGARLSQATVVEQEAEAALAAARADRERARADHAALEDACAQAGDTVAAAQELAEAARAALDALRRRPHRPG